MVAQVLVSKVIDRLLSQVELESDGSGFNRCFNILGNVRIISKKIFGCLCSIHGLQPLQGGILSYSQQGENGVSVGIAGGFRLSEFIHMFIDDNRLVFLSKASSLFDSCGGTISFFNWIEYLLADFNCCYQLANGLITIHCFHHVAEIIPVHVYFQFRATAPLSMDCSVRVDIFGKPTSLDFLSSFLEYSRDELNVFTIFPWKHLNMRKSLQIDTNELDRHIWTQISVFVSKCLSGKHDELSVSITEYFNRKYSGDYDGFPRISISDFAVRFSEPDNIFTYQIPASFTEFCRMMLDLMKFRNNMSRSIAECRLDLIQDELFPYHCLIDGIDTAKFVSYLLSDNILDGNTVFKSNVIDVIGEKKVFAVLDFILENRSWSLSISKNCFALGTYLKNIFSQPVQVTISVAPGRNNVFLSFYGHVTHPVNELSTEVLTSMIGLMASTKQDSVSIASLKMVDPILESVLDPSQNFFEEFVGIQCIPVDQIENWDEFLSSWTKQFHEISHCEDFFVMYTDGNTGIVPRLVSEMCFTYFQFHSHNIMDIYLSEIDIPGFTWIPLQSFRLLELLYFIFQQYDPNPRVLEYVILLGAFFEKRDWIVSVGYKTMFLYTSFELCGCIPIQLSLSVYNAYDLDESVIFGLRLCIFDHILSVEEIHKLFLSLDSLISDSDLKAFELDSNYKPTFVGSDEEMELFLHKCLFECIQFSKLCFKLPDILYTRTEKLLSDPLVNPGGKCRIEMVCKPVEELSFSAFITICSASLLKVVYDSADFIFKIDSILCHSLSFGKKSTFILQSFDFGKLFDSLGVEEEFESQVATFQAENSDLHILVISESSVSIRSYPLQQTGITFQMENDSGFRITGYHSTQ